MEKLSQIKYVRPDFKKAADEMRGCAQALRLAKDYKSARAQYLKLEKISDHISTASGLAYIRNTCDMRDEFYRKEVDAFYENTPALGVIQNDANAAVLSSPFKADFEKEFGSDFILGLQAQLKLLDKKIVDDLVEESRLGQEYSRLTAECKTDYMGEECNFYGLAKFMLSTDRSVRRGAFFEFSRLYAQIAPKLDEIFDKLICLRNGMASKLGFKSFAEMAYLQNGHYYYGESEVAEFRNQIIKEAVPFAARLYESQRARLGVDKIRYYDEELCFSGGNAKPAGDKDYLLKCAEEMYTDMSAESGEFFGFMLKHGLFDLETRAGKHLGGYCTMLEDFRAPFIFSNFNGSSADVDVLTHEAGHAFQAYEAAKTVKLTSMIWSTNEVSEIHSMTMELFAYPYMDKFFGKDAEIYRYAHLSGTVKVLPYLCLVDHFQHETYAHAYNAEQRRKCWRELEKIHMPWRDYDGDEFMRGGGFWMQKQHIFLYPFYYVDYALAQICAYNYYGLAKRDKSAAWQKYLELCRAGGSKGYFQLLKIGGLESPFAQGAVKRALENVKAELSDKF